MIFACVYSIVESHSTPCSYICRYSQNRIVRNDAFVCLQVFTEWNHTELESFLIEITSEILKYHDADNESLIDKIVDKAGQVSRLV